MIVVMCVSAVVCLAGIAIVNLAKNPAAASAGIIIAIVGAACLTISFLAWMTTASPETSPSKHRAMSALGSAQVSR